MSGKAAAGCHRVDEEISSVLYISFFPPEESCHIAVLNFFLLKNLESLILKFVHSAGISAQRDLE